MRRSWASNVLQKFIEVCLLVVFGKVCGGISHNDDEFSMSVFKACFEHAVVDRPPADECFSCVRGHGEGRSSQSCHCGPTTLSGNFLPNVRPTHTSASHTVRLGRCCTCQPRGKLGNLGLLGGVLGRYRLRLSGHAVYRDEIVVQWPAS